MKNNSAGFRSQGSVGFFVCQFICLFSLGNSLLTPLPHSKLVTAKLSPTLKNEIPVKERESKRTLPHFSFFPCSPSSLLSGEKDKKFPVEKVLVGSMWKDFC